MNREELLALARPVLERLRTLDADRPQEASKALAALDASALFAGLRAAHAEGWLTPKENAGIRFGRVAKAGPDTLGFSIDAVEMAGPAPGPHTHPNGEFSLSVAISGHPRFDGHAAGVPVVYPPGSRHVPTVQGGTMLIVYFLPEGEIAFEPEAVAR